TPSEKGMERLRSAVQNSGGYNTSSAAPEEDQDQAEKPRFGIGSLINRMSGNDADKSRFGLRKQPSPPAFSTRSEAPAEETQPADPEQERIEVPAFLRRQAN
ncbi:MAG: cell division protein FtsZ, partial [Paracoccaceae bacterium]